MYEWAQLTWKEIQQLCESGIKSALLPVGAIEQHGPHLGTGVDATIADLVSKAAVENSHTLLLPTLPYGCSIGHSRRWPGTIALQPKTLIDVVHNIGQWVHHSGFRQLFIINAHVTNFAPLRCALEMLRAEFDDFQVALINTPEISPRVKEAHFNDADDWHANDAETSLIQAIAPELLREDEIANADDPDRTTECVFSHPVNRTSANGVTGTPSLASLEKGQSLFSMMTEDLALLLAKGEKEQPPLPYSYFHPVSR